MTSVKDSVKDTVKTAGESVSSGYHAAVDAAAKAAAATKESTSHAYDATRRSAKVAAEKAGTSVDQNPLAVLAGGIALGAVVGALLPKTQRETEVVGGLGKKVVETASAAADAAREAGRQELDSLGLNKDAAKDQVSTLLDGVMQAVKTAGSAAAAEVKKSPPTQG